MNALSKCQYNFDTEYYASSWLVASATAINDASTTARNNWSNYYGKAQLRGGVGQGSNCVISGPINCRRATSLLRWQVTAAAFRLRRRSTRECSAFRSFVSSGCAIVWSTAIRLGWHRACAECGLNAHRPARTMSDTRRNSEGICISHGCIIIIIITRIVLECRTANSFENTEQGQKTARRERNSVAVKTGTSQRGTFLSDAWRRISLKSPRRRTATRSRREPRPSGRNGRRLSLYALAEPPVRAKMLTAAAKSCTAVQPIVFADARHFKGFLSWLQCGGRYVTIAVCRDYEKTQYFKKSFLNLNNVTKNKRFNITRQYQDSHASC